MKTRNGFVSNSSSSSFIVAVKDSDKTSTKVKVEMEINLAEYGQCLSTVEELDNYWSDQYCCEDEEARDGDQNYQHAKKAIQKGKTVIVGSFSDEGTEAVESLLCNNGLEGLIKDSNIEIIHSEAGY